MTNVSLAQSLIKKAIDRMDILELLMKKGAYSDVVREAQEIVELALKGMLRAVGIEPPKYHDVGSLLLEHKNKYSKDIAIHLKEIADISKRLRKERELAFYGDIDFIPTEEYKRKDGQEALKNAKFVVSIAQKWTKLYAKRTQKK